MTLTQIGFDSDPNQVDELLNLALLLSRTSPPCTSLTITITITHEHTMTIWDKVKEGIDKAGKAAQDVLDDGKTRLDAYRAREHADKAAEAFGYALFRAMEQGQELDADSKNRLTQSLRERDGEAHRLETILADEKKAEADSNANADSPTEPPITQV